MSADLSDDSDIPRFGEREPGTEYRPRPGAYAIIQDGAGRMAVMQTAVGLYLLGGGIDPGETSEAALRREIREECGGEVGELTYIGAAVEFVHTEGEPQGIVKQCVFYSAVFLNAPLPGECDPGETLIWLPASEAATTMRHGSARWAIQTVLHRDWHNSAEISSP